MSPYAVSKGMKKADDLLDAMRRNPASDWTIDDVRRVCEQHGCEGLAPTRGSHWKVAAPGRPDILAIPARRPIKVICIRKLVAMLEGMGRDGKGH
jgi:hypothetical protein